MFIVKNRKIFFGFSVLLIAFSFFAMFSFGFNFGIDFVGGTIYEVSFTQVRPDIETTRSLIDLV